MESEKRITIRRRLTFSGIAEAARAAGCSAPHLSEVLQGRRKSLRLLRRLRELGIEVKGVKVLKG